MYRWASGNQTRAWTEPTPSELLKATGMQPSTRRAEPAYAQVGVNKGRDKGLFRVNFINGLIFVHTLFMLGGYECTY